MKSKVLFLVLCGMVYSSSCSIAQNVIVDSNYTFQEAIAGTKAPDSIINNLTLLDVEYYSFDKKLHRGQIVIHKRLADDVAAIFRVIKQNKFPIQHAIPIVRYNWSDSLSLIANNTSCFNFRPVTGGKKLSNHSYGVALDINTVQNPYIKGNVVLPKGAVYNPAVPGTLYDKLFINQLFYKKGWQWGGNWVSLKDYQHFEKPSILE